MKYILLSWLPKSGKSTLLQGLIQDLESKKWFLTQEILQDEKRIGFEIQDSFGNTSLLASKLEKSAYTVWSFSVFPENLSSHIGALKNSPYEEYLYIDEIGPMELLSPVFEEYIQNVLSSNQKCIFIISEVFEHPLIQSLRNHPEAKLWRLTPENRDAYLEEIRHYINHN